MKRWNRKNAERKSQTKAERVDLAVDGYREDEDEDEEEKEEKEKKWSTVQKKDTRINELIISRGDMRAI